jgi:hypothetical protein
MGVDITVRGDLLSLRDQKIYIKEYMNCTENIINSSEANGSIKILMNEGHIGRVNKER